MSTRGFKDYWPADVRLMPLEELVDNYAPYNSHLDPATLWENTWLHWVRNNMAYLDQYRDELRAGGYPYYASLHPDGHLCWGEGLVLAAMMENITEVPVLVLGETGVSGLTNA